MKARKQKNVLLIVAAIFILSLNIFAQSQNNITGKWKSEDKEKQMQMTIYKADDDKYYSKIISDSNSKSSNDKTVLKGLVYDEASKNFKGIMQPPDANMELNVTVSFENNDRLKLVAKKLLMSKTMYLTRIK